MMEALDRFAGCREFTKLPGGQNTSVRAADIVLKPVDDADKYCWLSEELSKIPSRQIAFARPIRSCRGNWVEEGFGATEFIPGEFFTSRMPEKLAAAEEFHRMTAAIQKPSNLDFGATPWTKANRLAWREAALPDRLAAPVAKVISTLAEQCRAIDLPYRFIHSDLAGNILFQGDRAIVIDISPVFRPVEYALALLVTDSVAWHREPAGSIELLQLPRELRRQLVLRAVLFRISVPLFFDEQNQEAFFAELENFQPILNWENITI